MTPLFAALATASIAWLLWRATRDIFIRSPLDNIPGPESPSYFTGNFGKLFDRQGWDFLESLGTQYSSVVKLTGLFGKKALYVFDPIALHRVTIKEAEFYNKPQWMFESINMTIGPGLFGVHGTTHRKQRKMLNPVFSIKHMRGLTPIFYNIAHKLCAGLETQIGDTAATVEINGWLGRTALELIGQGGIGCSLDSLEKPVHNPFGDALKDLLPGVFDFADWLPLWRYAKKLGPLWFRNKMAEILPIPRLNKLKRVVATVETESKKILEEKKAALIDGNGKVAGLVGEGKDTMSLLLRTNMAASEDEGLSDEELLGQMSTLVLAGTDSTSNALCKTIEIMTHRPDVQDKLRAEIVEAQERCGSDIPYDELVSLPYLDAFCRESLRMDPPVPFTFREAQKDIIMPVSQPITGVDGTTMNEIPVPAGTTIVLAVRGSNLNRDIWGDDVLKFKPERWLSPLPSTVTESHIPGVYSHLMTFHGGGRSCIGFKFSQLEMKVILAALIPKFKFSMAKNAGDIIWNLSGINFPSVGRDSAPAFPVVMERAKV